MKKLMLLIVLMSVPMTVKADSLCTNWGTGLNVCLPLTSLEAAYGYNFNARERGNQALLETPIAKIKSRLVITFGAAKSVGEGASPYISATYGIVNPIEKEGNPLSWIRPGVYGGKHFDTKEWIYGLKASVPVF